ncbi:sulfite exporter TauE/SafE family protein [Parachitinimonas caeni]|uniref:Probable membrane transporter protein n=1 Tax=Parachitinimonas caeni TaxID=3031301 RepID=A0ABT7DZ14_9NEIS|nr:sulfite exporter TauE/SafE family protein [Parachitinimonas caeni]MDK2125064.1 sulfite exporter TauE/SafE family protein [Parachitinimonas caeni]
MDIGYIIAGLAVGFIVGLTGIGGGSLMTPILLAFGISPAKAVGTDLLYAAITKAGGVFVHHRRGNIDWRITAWLSAGSVPAAALTLYGMHLLQPANAVLDGMIKHALGIALLLTALAIIFKGPIARFTKQHAGASSLLSPAGRNAATLITGVFLGVLVTLSSIGAGALGTVALFLLFPLLPASRLVGTEIAHAVPLTLVAGLGHSTLGHIDWMLLLNLIGGSLPGIYLGSHLTGRIPDQALRPIIAVMLATVGARLAF